MWAIGKKNNHCSIEIGCQYYNLLSHKRHPSCTLALSERPLDPCCVWYVPICDRVVINVAEGKALFLKRLCLYEASLYTYRVREAYQITSQTSLRRKDKGRSWWRVGWKGEGIGFPYNTFFFSFLCKGNTYNLVSLNWGYFFLKEARISLIGSTVALSKGFKSSSTKGVSPWSFLIEPKRVKKQKG